MYFILKLKKKVSRQDQTTASSWRQAKYRNVFQEALLKYLVYILAKIAAPTYFYQF